MEMIDKHIVSIDLGTSKIGVTVAKVTGNDVQVIYYAETPSKGIRYSGVLNVSQASEALGYAIAEAEKNLNIKITQAVVGMPKYPIRIENACGKRVNRGEDKEITEESIESLKKSALENYPLENEEKQAIFGAVAQSFSDGENFQIIEKDIIGMISDTLEGNFNIFIGKRGDLKRIDQVMDRVGVVPVRKFFTAESTARATLTSQEMENGVALIDFGAGCVSVSIYCGNIMRHYASIPFGGKNITDDVKNEAEISERLAENIKMAFGACMPEKLQSMSEKNIQIQDEGSEKKTKIPVKYLSEIITARVEEILMAILWEMEQSGIADNLKHGIVVTGGVANTVNLCNFITEISGYRARVGYPIIPFSYQGCENLLDPAASSSIGLITAALSKANINCALSQDEAIEEVEETEVEAEVSGEGIEAEGSGERVETEGTGEDIETEETEEPEIDKQNEEEPGVNRDLWGNIIGSKKKRKNRNAQANQNDENAKKEKKEKEKKEKDNEPTLWTIIKTGIEDMVKSGNGQV